MGLETFIKVPPRKEEVERLKEALMKEGLSPEQALREAEARVFSKQTVFKLMSNVGKGVQKIQYFITFLFDDLASAKQVESFFSKKAGDKRLDGYELLKMIEKSDHGFVH